MWLAQVEAPPAKAGNARMDVRVVCSPPGSHGWQLRFQHARIDVDQAEIDALIKRGYVEAAQRNDVAAIGHAVTAFRWRSLFCALRAKGRPAYLLICRSICFQLGKLLSGKDFKLGILGRKSTL
jgi:hypothetical protein